MRVATQTLKKPFQRLATHKHDLNFSETIKSGSVLLSKMSETELKSVKYATEKEKVEPKLSCERLTINDSNDPSYSNLTVPYRVICRQRYTKSGTQQRLQFLKEIRKQEISQSRALNGVRIHRIFLNPVLVPPKREEIIKLTPKQEFKLEQLLKE